MYYRGLIDQFDRTDWPRKDGTVLRLRDVGLDPMVLKRPLIIRPERGKESLSGRVSTVYRATAIVNEESPQDVRTELVPWKKELPAIQRAIIVGPPGGGKTTLAATAVISIARMAEAAINTRSSSLDDLPFPVFLSLEMLGRTSEDSLAAAAMAQLRPKSRLLESWISARLFTARCTWILDGLDQVAGEAARKRIFAWLDQIRGRGPVIVTCRTAVFDQMNLSVGYDRYDLAPFSADEVRRFVRRFYSADTSRGDHFSDILAHNPSLLDACGSPLIATFSCLENEAPSMPLPVDITVAELYERVLRRLMSHHESLQYDGALGETFLAVQHVAFTLFAARPESNLFSELELLSAAGRGAGRLIDILTNCRVLVRAASSPSGEPFYSFIHRSVLEFLTARHMATRIRQSDWQVAAVELPDRHMLFLLSVFLDRKSWLPEWWQTICFLAGSLGRDAFPLIDLLINGREDMAWHRRVLALHCLVQLRRNDRQSSQVDLLSQQMFNFLGARHQHLMQVIVPMYDSSWSALAVLDGHVGEEGFSEKVTKAISYGMVEGVHLACRIRHRHQSNDELIKALRDFSRYAIRIDPIQRGIALEALANISRFEPEALRVLTECLEWTDEPVRPFLVKKLGENAVSSREVLSTLRNVARHRFEKAYTRVVAARYVVAADPAEQGLLAALEGVASDRDHRASVRVEALLGLRDAKGGCLPAPLLNRLLLDESEDDWVRNMAAEILIQETRLDSAALGALRSGVFRQDADVDARITSARLLYKAGEWGPVIGAAIRAMAFDPATENRARLAALKCLWLTADIAEEEVGMIQRLASEETGTVGMSAAEFLYEMRGAVPETIQAFRNTMRDEKESDEVRTNAAEKLTVMACADEETARVLFEARSWEALSRVFSRGVRLFGGYDGAGVEFETVRSLSALSGNEIL